MWEDMDSRKKSKGQRLFSNGVVVLVCLILAAQAVFFGKYLIDGRRAMREGQRRGSGRKRLRHLRRKRFRLLRTMLQGGKAILLRKLHPFRKVRPPTRLQPARSVLRTIIRQNRHFPPYLPPPQHPPRTAPRTPTVPGTAGPPTTAPPSHTPTTAGAGTASNSTPPTAPPWTPSPASAPTTPARSWPTASAWASTQTYPSSWTSAAWTPPASGV